MANMGIFEELTARGLVEAVSDAKLGELLNTERVTFYTGYDPTAPSLQIGNLCAIVTQRRLQTAGHRPIVIMGGATGMIGDPSGKSEERNLLTEDTIAKNLAAQRRQFERLIDFSGGDSGALLLNNHDWIGQFSFIGFLRDVGKRFRMGEMLSKESVKRRLESEAGLSFTEFCYQMLQAYDFMHLHKAHGVRLQVGGADQWGNITAGIDLTRKVEGAAVYGMVFPLLTDPQGRKFGKSEGNAIYLDAGMTSPYQMYQYLLNAEDSHVIKYLKVLTFFTLDEIAQLERELQTTPDARTAQKALAAHVTEMVHGKEGLAAAEAASSALFGGSLDNLSAADLASIFKDVPSVTVARATFEAGLGVVDLFALTPLCPSKSEARRAVQQGGAYVNNRAVTALDATLSLADCIGGTTLVLRKGKKNYCLVQVG